MLARNNQNDSKDPTKTSKEENDLITTLRREVRDLKSERDKQLATKDRQIDHLTKLIDQQQQLQLTTIAENKELKKYIRKLSSRIESFDIIEKRQQVKNNDKTRNDKQTTETDDSKKQIYKNKVYRKWWRFWK